VPRKGSFGNSKKTIAISGYFLYDSKPFVLASTFFRGKYVLMVLTPHTNSFSVDGAVVLFLPFISHQ
jgi:hypothetical protein